LLAVGYTAGVGLGWVGANPLHILPLSAPNPIASSPKTTDLDQVRGRGRGRGKGRSRGRDRGRAELGLDRRPTRRRVSGRMPRSRRSRAERWCAPGWGRGVGGRATARVKGSEE